MANHLKVFENETAYSAFTGSSAYVTPNVSVCSGGGGSIFYNPLENHDYSKDYLTFIPRTDGTFSINENFSGTTSNTISYSIGDGNWTNIAYGVQTPTVQAGQKIRFKGIPDASYTDNMKSIGTFQCTTSFDAEGNAMSMTHGDDFQGVTSIESNNELAGLFSVSSIISAENVVLPATTLTNGCYCQMFSDCRSLTSTPALPATTLAEACYDSMFAKCSSLSTAPELPATELAFNCYANMFSNCTGLTTAPELRAMTLARGCYSQMFLGCTSLVTAPELPADILTNGCYGAMFNGCTNLNSITCLATDISATNCTSSWVYGVASSGTFTKAASMISWPTTRANGIPSGWTVVDKS